MWLMPIVNLCSRYVQCIRTSTYYRGKVKWNEIIVEGTDLTLWCVETSFGLYIFQNDQVRIFHQVSCSEFDGSSATRRFDVFHNSSSQHSKSSLNSLKGVTTDHLNVLLHFHRFCITAFHGFSLLGLSGINLKSLKLLNIFLNFLKIAVRGKNFVYKSPRCIERKVTQSYKLHWVGRKPNLVRTGLTQPNPSFP